MTRAIDDEHPIAVVGASRDVVEDGQVPAEPQLDPVRTDRVGWRAEQADPEVRHRVLPEVLLRVQVLQHIQHGSAVEDLLPPVVFRLPDGQVRLVLLLLLVTFDGLQVVDTGLVLDGQSWTPVDILSASSAWQTSYRAGSGVTFNAKHPSGGDGLRPAVAVGSSTLMRRREERVDFGRRRATAF